VTRGPAEGGFGDCSIIFNPAKPTEFVVAVQHLTSVALNLVPDGFGDAVWQFNLDEIVDKKFLQSLQWAHMVKNIKKRFCDYMSSREG
jgi:hypothetical protein